MIKSGESKTASRPCRACVDLSYLLTSANVPDADEVRQLIAFAASRNCTKAGRDTGHDAETIAKTWDRFAPRLIKALESLTEPE